MKPQKMLGLFILALLNLSVMTSLRNLPIVSEYGFAAPFFYLTVALVFLFPMALVSAELATGWPERGGVYVWVKEAFGPKWGFFAIWMQWIHNVTWYPAILSFAATAFAYLFDPTMAENKTYLICCILGGFWGFTLFNFLGLRTSSRFSAAGVICGTIIPGFLLVILGAAWLIGGNPSEIEFTWAAAIPQIDNLENLVFLTGLFLAFGGLEVSAAHALEVKNPQKNFPRAILIAAVLALVIYALGALAIAIMIPKQEISLVAGLIEAFSRFLGHFGFKEALPLLGLMIVFGAVGELNAWIIGPVKALHATTKHGDLPPMFQKTNKNDIPVNLLLFQGAIVTIATFVFLYMPSASSAFWILSAMSAQLYLVMYVLMFAAAIRLRYTHAKTPRAYKVPGGKTGIWIAGVVGILSSTVGYLIGFAPPSQIETGSLGFYESFLLLGNLLMIAIPLIIYSFKHPSWKR